MENISVALKADSGTVSLLPMMMELGRPGLSVDVTDGGEDGLVLQGRVEVINSALQSFQYLGYISDLLNLQTRSQPAGTIFTHCLLLIVSQERELQWRGHDSGFQPEQERKE